MNGQPRPDPHDILRAEAAERTLASPKLPTPAELSELRSYATALSGLAANAAKLDAILPGQQWRVRDAAATLNQLRLEAWMALSAAELRTLGYQKTKEPTR